MQVNYSKLESFSYYSGPGCKRLTLKLSVL
jgi:hypothetical protein